VIIVPTTSFKSITWKSNNLLVVFLKERLERANAFLDMARNCNDADIHFFSDFFLGEVIEKNKLDNLASMLF
jgi:hypothetical protein